MGPSVAGQIERLKKRALRLTLTMAQREERRSYQHNMRRRGEI